MLKIDELISAYNADLVKMRATKGKKELEGFAENLISMKKEIKTLDKTIMADIDGYLCKSVDDHSGNIDLSTGTLQNMNGENEMHKSKLTFLNLANIDKVYENKENLDLGNYVRGALTGQWGDAAKEMDSFKALNTSTGTVLIPQSLSAQILKKVMNKSLIYSSGVPVIAMPAGNMTIAKVTQNPTFGFKEELATVTPQDATFEGVDLKGKMVYGLMKVSLEVLHSAQNLTDVLLQAMSDAVSDAIDKSCLFGEGPTDIKGIFNYSEINTVAATKIDYLQFVNAVGKIRQANGEPSVMGINATTDNALNLLVDTTGQPLVAPKVIDSLNRIVSNNLRNNQGVGLDEGEAIVYDPNALILGNQVQFMFETSREKGFDDGSVYLRVYSLLDMAIVRPEYITKITALK